MPPPAPAAIVWRTSSQLAQAVRSARERLGLTQGDLAKRARVGMKFLYELEAGKDTLRSDKVLDVLDVLGLRLVVAASRPAIEPPAPELREERAGYRALRAPAAPDWIGMACTTSGVSLRTALAPDELIRALLTGVPPSAKRANLVVLLEEAPAELLRGLAGQVGAWARPGVVSKNLRRLARRLGVRRRDLP